MNKWTCVKANRSPADESDLRFGDLVTAIRLEGRDTPKLARWYLTRLASAFHVPITLGDMDALEHFRILARKAAWVLDIAGAPLDSRTEAAEAAVDLARVLGEVMSAWTDEAHTGPHCPVSPLSLP